MHANDANSNEGRSDWLRVWAPSNNRALVYAPIEDVRARLGDRGTLRHAYLRLDLIINDRGNGDERGGDDHGHDHGTPGHPDGQWVAVHRLTSAWSEGNGFVAENTGPMALRRGYGAGATWNCAIDTNISNHHGDCSGATAWTMDARGPNPWITPAISTVRIANAQHGLVYWEVTADVLDMLAGGSNHGWIVKAEDENHGGRMLFSSRTGPGNAPALVIDYDADTNAPPDLALGTGATIDEGDRFLRTASAGDPDSTSWTGTIDWGDGSSEPLSVLAGGDFVLDHVYADDGEYSVTVTATDELGDSDTDSVVITVRNVAPAVNAGEDASVDEGSSFAGLASFTDPGADQWIATIDWGDGSSESNASSGGSIALAHAYATPGTRTLTITVCDDDGACGSDTASIQTRDRAPIASFIFSPAPQVEGAPISFTNLTAIEPYDPLTYQWDFGSTDQHPEHTFDSDGVYTVCLTATDDEGTSDTSCADVVILDLAPSADFTWSPSPQDEGAPIDFTDASQSSPDAIVERFWNFGSTELNPSFTFTADGAHLVCLMVIDGDGSEDTSCHHVEVRNLPPRADAGGPYVAEAGQTAITVSAAGSSDPGSDIVAYHWDFDGDGAFDDATGVTATLISSSGGDRTIRVRVTDDDGASDVAVATAHFPNVAPSAAIATASEADEGDTVALDARGSSDPEGGALSYDWDLDGDGTFGDSAAPTTAVFSADDAVRTVRVRVTDGEGAEDVAEHQITWRNVAPAVASADVTVDEGQTALLFANITDRGADTFTATADTGDGPQPVAVIGGRAELSISLADDTHREVIWQVTDDDGGTTTAIARLVARNVAPSVEAGANVTIGTGQSVTRTLALFDPGADQLEAIADFSDGRGPQPLALLGDRSVALSHTFASLGTFTVLVLVRDDEGAIGSDTFTVTVAGPLTCPVGTADCDANPANGCESTSTSCVPAPPIGCTVPTLASASHGSIDGQGDRDGGARPVSLMFDGDATTRSRYRVGGTAAFVVNVSFVSPVDLDAIRTYTPVGLQTGFAGIRIETSDGSGFVERYLDPRMFGIVGRFASSLYFPGGRDFPAGYVGVAGVVDHVFPGGIVRNVRSVRLTLGWVDEISPEFPGGGDAVYSISEMWFCNAGAPPPPPPLVVEVDAGPDVTIGEGETFFASGTVTAPPGLSLEGSVYWGDGRFGDSSAFAQPLALDFAPPSADGDQDGTGASDNCPGVPNHDQADADGDGAGNLCDPDADGDGRANTTDLCPLQNASAADANADGCLDLPGSGFVRFGALMDGRSRFVIRGNEVWWQHFDFAGPGLHAGNRLPTPISAGLDGVTLQSVNWCPTWTNGCNNCDGSCGELRQRIDSLPFTGLNPPLPATTLGTVTLDRIACRQTCTLIQTPSAANSYTAIVELDDNAPGGSATYDLRLNYTFAAPDADGDGVVNTRDNCPSVANATQADVDADFIGDACESDRDNDGILDAADNCQTAANAEQADEDADAIGDACDADFVAQNVGTFELSHLFNDSGTYVVLVAATDPALGTFADVVIVQVTNGSPSISLSALGSAVVGSEYEVFGSVSDPGADAVSVSVDWGDGRSDAVANLGGSITARHVYLAEGAYTVRVTATDDEGASSQASLSVAVSHCPAMRGDCNGSLLDGCEVELDVPDHCGACGNVCASAANATGSCTSGQCGVQCVAGFADCNGIAADGCETDLAAPESCGACANNCAGAPNASGSCSNGACDFSCDAGFEDCDGSAANGCEAELAADPANCGACARACPARDGADATCTDRSCGFSCRAGFADCDGVAANGCEGDLGGAESCGACGNSCPTFANATATCESGTCGRACASGWDDCDADSSNGCETSVANDADSCGACGHTCLDAPNAAAACANGLCTISCAAGFANCDGDASNGCETIGRCVCVAPFEDCDGEAANGCEVDLSASAEHCGSCGSACTFANASGACIGGSCALGTCDSAFGDCNGSAEDGCETPLDAHAQNCGACGVTCPSGQACESGSCRSLLPEVCNGRDDDADGRIDDGLVAACNTACGAGAITCSGGRWGACSAPRPAAEVCNNRDDDCDGLIDDGIFPGCAIPSCVNPNGAAPALALTSPAADAAFGSAFDVQGTIADTDLDSWIVDFLPAGGATPIVLFTGSSAISGGQLGRVQPAMLPSGIGQLRVRALDCEGHLSLVERAIKIESDNLLGAVRLSFEDLAVDVAGVPIQLVRTYDSRDRATPGDFGHGWSLAVSTRSKMSRNIPLGRDWAVVCGFFGRRTATELTGHTVEVRLGPARYRFRPVVTGLSPIGGGCTGTMSFQYAGGTGRASLLGSIFVFHDNNMPGHFRDDLGSPELADLQPLTLALPDGRRFALSARGQLTSLGDAAGNQVTITSNAISHSAGASVAITRDGSGRITRITDPSGAHLDYAYSAAGDLVSVTDRASNTSTFQYAYDHNLERYDDAEGHTPMRVEHDADGRVGAFLDANQAPVAFAYDDLANSVAIDSPDGTTNEVVFDATGQAIGVESNGETSSMVYDAEGRLIGDQSPRSGSTSREFDARGNVIREVDASGGVTTHDLTYSGDTIIARVTTAPGGAITRREYDSAGRITRQVDPSGATSTMVYNAQGNLTRLAVDNDGRVEETTYGYDALGRLTSTTDPLGRTTSSALDALGRVTARTQTFTPAGGPPVSITTTMELDANGRPLGSTDPLGRVTARALDSRGRPTSLSGGRSGPQTFVLDPNGVAMQMTNALGETFASARDESGRLTSTVDESGVRFDFSYDAQGNLASYGAAGLAPRARSFDASGRITREESPGGDVITFAYDGAGRETEVRGSDGTVFKRAFDEAGRVSMTEDALGRQTFYEYDTAGNLIRETAPGGAETLYGYDARGRRTSITDALGNITRFEYDAAGQRTKLIDQAGEEWRFEYDELGNLIRMIDPHGAARVWERNARGEVLREVFAGGAAISYEYDGAGRLTRQTNPGGDYVRFGYDAAGRLIEKAMSTGEVHTFTYGASGRQELASGPVGARSFVYDAQGRATSIVLEDGTQVAYEYDAAGRRTRMRWDTHDVRWEYDARERISRVHDESGTFAYTYDNAGMVTQLTRPNGTSSNYGYDIRDRVTLVEHRDPGGAIFDRATFTYDAIGRMTSATRSFGGANVSYDFDYDPRGFLTLEQRNDGATIETIGYTYDAAGNRLTRVDNSGSITYVYDADDRLLSAGATTYGYDDAGRLISITDGASSSSFDWSAGGELISATAGGVTETYDYDANGLRIRRTSGGASTAAIWDDSAPGVPMLAGERAPSGDRANTWANGLLRSGDHFVHEDSRRNIDALSDAAGAVTAQLEYSAFGEPRSASPIPFGYRSELTDQLTGFQYLRARYYQPSIGRFISRDDIEINTRDARTFARYAYGNNDPLMYSDPSGRFGFMGISFSWGFGGGAVGIFWQVMRGLGYAAALYCAGDFANLNPSHGCTAGATAAKDLVFQVGLQPPEFPKASSRQQSIIGELFDWNKSIILPRIFPLLGGRMGWAGNTLSERFKCYCVNNRASNELQTYAWSMGEYLGGNMVGLGNSPSNEHNVGHLRLDGTLEIWVDDWKPFVDPLSPNAPKGADPNNTWQIDPDLNCQTARL